MIYKSCVDRIILYSCLCNYRDSSDEEMESPPPASISPKSLIDAPKSNQGTYQHQTFHHGPSRPLLYIRFINITNFLNYEMNY